MKFSLLNNIYLNYYYFYTFFFLWQIIYLKNIYIYLYQEFNNKRLALLSLLFLFMKQFDLMLK